MYGKTCLKRPLKNWTKIGLQDRLSFNAAQKYCRMLQGEHSAILSTFIKLPFVVKIFVLSIFEWPLKTGFYCIFIHSIYIFIYVRPAKVFNVDQCVNVARISLFQKCDFTKALLE